MDLAKIRKKYRQPLAENSSVSLQSDIQTVAPVEPSPEPAREVSVSRMFNVPDTVFPGKSVQVSPVEHLTETVPSFRNPIEIILAGRSAAGCDAETPDEEELAQTVSGNCLEYLCFRVSDEIYGINIMDIKEIIKPREVTEIPRAPDFVSGIISLRGTIIPIIDMRSRLGLSLENATGRERIIVIRHDQSFSGLVVDEVIQVVRVNKENMEPAPSVLEGIDRDFVSGIGRFDGRLMIILNLKSIADINLY
ncbi:MAG: chemotaxis protein CheW [Desulfuromonadales bacterium]